MDLRPKPEPWCSEIDRVDQAVRSAANRGLLTVACKERALACWLLLRATGIPAALVVGVSLFPLAGHCWCEVGSRVLSDDPERCETFSPVLRYAGRGHLAR